MRGTVVYWIPSKSYGFVKPDGEAHDVYVQLSEVTEGKIFQGARVEFSRTKSKITRGRHHAADVRVIQ
jgi:cold shock CspA family protein